MSSREVQGRLFIEPRFERVCREILLPGGLYSPASVIVEAIRGLAPVDKAVYRAGLHHLRGAGTHVSLGLNRLSTMIGASRRSAARGIDGLHRAWLIDAWRLRSGLWCWGYADLRWWLAEHSARIDPGLIQRLLHLYRAEPAIAEFVASALVPPVAAPPSPPQSAAP